MLTYDSDGHFCEDDASAKLDEDDEGDADIDSYKKLNFLVLSLY